MLTSTMIYTGFAQFIGGPFIYGWHINCVGLPGGYIKAFINKSLYDHYGKQDAPGETTWQDAMMSVVVLLLSLGGAIGGFLSAKMADKFGRKKSVLMTHVLTLIAAALYGICKVTNCFELLFVARLLAGFSSGACFAIVPVYATEIMPSSIRGAVGTCSQLSITLGIFISTVFVLEDTMGTNELWPIGMCLLAVFSMLSAVMLILPMAAESPKWLLVVRKDERAAENELRKLYKRQDVSDLIYEMKKEANLIQVAGAPPPINEEWGFGKLFSTPHLRWPIIIVICLNLSQQLSGINVVFFYSKTLYEGAGIKGVATGYASLVVNAINVVTTIVAVPLIERFGRRSVLLYPMCLMCGALVGEVVLLTVPRYVVVSTYTQQIMSWIAIVCLGFFVIGFALGLGPIPNFSASEIFRPGPKATAAAVGTVTNLTGTLLVSILFENVLQKYLLSFSFLPFLAISIFFLVFFWIRLPETKNRSISEIYRSLGSRNEDDGMDMGMAMAVPIISAPVVIVPPPQPFAVANYPVPPPPGPMQYQQPPPQQYSTNQPPN